MHAFPKDPEPPAEPLTDPCGRPAVEKLSSEEDLQKFIEATPVAFVMVGKEGAHPGLEVTKYANAYACGHPEKIRFLAQPYTSIPWADTDAANIPITTAS